MRGSRAPDKVPSVCKLEEKNYVTQTGLGSVHERNGGFTPITSDLHAGSNTNNPKPDEPVKTASEEFRPREHGGQGVVPGKGN